VATIEGFVGGSGTVRSRNVDAERTVNLYPEAVGGTPKARSWLVPTPGLAPFTVLGDGPVRALFSMDGRTFAVGGVFFYEVFASGTVQYIGEVRKDGNPATIASSGTNGNQLYIVSGGENYIYALDTGTLTHLQANGPPTPTRMGLFSDGYFIALKALSNQFNISPLYDGLIWDPLDVYQISTVADQIVSITESHRDLVVLGSQTSSIWTNTGDADIVYQPVPGVKIDQGSAASFSAVRLDNTVYWLGQGEGGARVVYRLNGYTPERVSTHAVEYALGKASRVDDAVAYAYQEEGHAFYVLWVPDLANHRDAGTTWVYDVATQQWHERALWDPTVLMDWQPHPGRCHCYGFNRHLVGDRSSPAIYDMRLGVGEDILVEAGA
jgi:hypothetical protein